MLSKEMLQYYRELTPSQRLQITLNAIRDEAPQLLFGPPDMVKRRFELIRRRNEERNQNIVSGLLAAERRR